MAQVSNRFFVTSIKDGTAITAVIYSDKTLTQSVTPGTNASDPDWGTDTSAQPTVHCVVRAGATAKTPAQWTWKLNDVAITFPANPTAGTASTNFNGIFQWATVNIGGVACPAIKIVGNIISVTNQDNDVLSCEGSVEYNGAQISYSVATTIRISTLSGSGYFGWIDGDAYVTAQTGQAGTATMNARLKTADGAVHNFKTKWYLEPSANPFATVAAVSGVATASITGSQFVDYVVVRCDFFDANDTNYENVLYSAFWDVDDMEDEEEMYICSYIVSGVRSGLDVSLRDGQSAQMVVWMGKSGDQTQIDTRYTAFKCRLLDSDGNTITNLTGSGITTGSGSLTVDAQGFVNITKSDGITAPVTAAKAGTITIPATYATAKGGRITGIVVATSPST